MAPQTGHEREPEERPPPDDLPARIGHELEPDEGPDPAGSVPARPKPNVVQPNLVSPSENGHDKEPEEGIDSESGGQRPGRL